VPNVAQDFDDPKGVPIDAIIFGGRARDREPLIRAIADLAEGVYDGLTLGAEATFAAEGVEGLLRYDPMSMRPFMPYPEGAYAAHWLKVIGSAASQPIFAHVNWFQRDPEDGHYLWPGYRDNLRPLLWLLRLKEGEVRGRQTPVGIIPAQDELDLDGVATAPEELKNPVVAADLDGRDVAFSDVGADGARVGTQDGGGLADGGEVAALQISQAEVLGHLVGHGGTPETRWSECPLLA